MRVVDCPASNGTKGDTTSIRANEIRADNLVLSVIAAFYEHVGTNGLDCC